MSREKILRMSDSLIEQVENLASQGLTDNQIADSMCVSRSTISRRKKDNDAFDAAIKKGRGRGIQQVANALFESALAGSITAQIFFLEARAGWSDKPQEFPSNLPTPSITLIAPDENGRFIETDLAEVDIPRY